MHLAQVHCGDATLCSADHYKPILELYYTHVGNIQYTVEQGPSGPSGPSEYLGNIPVGTTFSWELRYDAGVLSVGLNGVFTTVNYYNWSVDNPETYFQWGNYNQASDDTETVVHYKSISVTHVA